MSTRIIKLKLLTQVSLVAIETGARTLGEFKELPEVQKLDLKWNQIKLIDRATKNSIDLDGALMPAIDCIIFVTPTKTDSGASDRKSLYAQIANLKQLGVEVNFNVTQTKSSVLEQFIADNTSEISEDTCNCGSGSQCQPASDEEFAKVVKTEFFEATHYADGAMLLTPMVVEETTTEDVDDVLDELAYFITNDELAEEQAEIVKAFKKR